MSDSVRPHRWQPTRLSRPWDSPGKNTGVGCHFLLQCMKVKSESEVAQSYLTPSDPMDCSLPGPSIHGIFQAGVLEWGAIVLFLSYNKWKGPRVFPDSLENILKGKKKVHQSITDASPKEFQGENESVWWKILVIPMLILFKVISKQTIHC